MEGTQAYNIGGLTLLLGGGADAELATRLPGMSAFAGTSGDSRPIHVTLDAHLPLPDCRWLHRFDIAGGEAECRFGITAEGAYLYTFADRGLLCYDPARPDSVAISSLADPTLLRFALWTAYSMAALPRGAVPVHSSAVVYRGRAVLCLGESGTGKSTHTALWMKYIDGCHLLNDDSPILRVGPDGVTAYGSPWSGKTPCYRQERVPVAALLRLEQRPQNTIRRLPVVEAFTALQPSCPPSLIRDPHCTDLLLDLIGQVLTHTPVYRLGCRPDADAARLAHKTLMA